VLDQHALECFGREVRVDCLAAESVEVVETANEQRILAALVFNNFEDGVREHRYAFGKLGDRLSPLLDIRSRVVEEAIYQLSEVVGLGDI
jgi:hypothetical protein